MFFSDKLMASIRLISQSSAESIDWTFLSVVFAFPVLSYHLAVRSKKWGIMDKLKKIKEKIKKKIAYLKEDSDSSKVWLILLIALLILVILVIVAISSIKIEVCNTDSVDTSSACKSE
jgi:hypothetical protein